MGFSLDKVKTTLFGIFRKVAIAIFTIVAIYTPIPALLNPEELKNARFLILFNLIISFLSILVTCVFSKFTKDISSNIIVLSFVFLIWVSLITLVSYSLNPFIIALLIIGLFPSVLVHKRILYIIHICIIVLTYIFTVYVQKTEIRATNLGLVKIESLSMGTHLGMTLVLLLGIVVAFFVRNSLLKIFDNVSQLIVESKEFTAQMKESERKTRAIFDLSSTLLSLLDSEGRIVEVNKTALDFVGAELHEAKGKPFENNTWWNYSNETIENVTNAIAKAKVGEVASFTIVCKSRKGTLHELAVTIKPIFDDLGKVIWLLAEGNDITEQKKSEEAILKLNRELEEKVRLRTRELKNANSLLAESNTLLVEANMGLEEEICERRKLEKELIIARNRAEESSSYKSKFVANMSHELRTPINAIVGFNHLLGKTSLSNKQKEYLEMSKTSANNLLSLINNILDFSKIELNKIELENIPFSIEKIFDNLHSIFITKADEKGLILKFQIDRNIPPVLFGDPTRLTQILMNLLNNAVKFTKKGFVLLSAKLDNTEDNMASVTFLVKDTGIGMTKQQLQKVFSPFTQADSSISREYGGSGLGLSICKQLTELMGGTIHGESVQNEGCSFFATLKFEYSHSVQMLLSDQEKNVDSISFDGKRVLLVDDNDMNQFISSEILKDTGMQLDVAWNGFEAIKKLTEGNRYDLILMDIHMPILNGYDAARKIREFDSHTPIIAITADAIKGVIQKVFASGMNGYISKPIDPYQMLLKIKDTIGTDSHVTHVSKYIDEGQSELNENNIEMPGLNTLEGIKRIDGKLDKYIHILKLFRDKQLNCHEQILKYLSNNEVEAAVRAAHTLKGSAASIGANDLAEVAKRIQYALQNDEQDFDIKKSLKELYEKLEQVKTSISIFITSYDKSGAEVAATTETKGGEEVIRILESMIKNMDTDAIDFFENYTNSLSSKYGNEKIEKLRYLLLNFNWQESSEFISGLKN